MLIFFGAQSCVATQDATQVRTYETRANSALSESSSMGRERLQGVLQNAGGDPAQVDRGELVDVSDRAERLYQEALTEMEVPPEFEDAHHYLISALGMRAATTERLERAAGGEPEAFVEELTGAVEDYRQSDGVVLDHYLPAAGAALEEAGAGSDQNRLEEPGTFMDYEELGFDAEPAPEEAGAQVDPNARRGVQISEVFVAQQPLPAGGNVILTGGAEPIFSVTIYNGGEVAENGVPVEVVLVTAVERQEQSVVVEQIEPDSVATVEVSGFTPGALDETAEVTVQVGPVESEENVDNNTLISAVTFGM